MCVTERGVRVAEEERAFRKMLAAGRGDQATRLPQRGHKKTAPDAAKQVCCRRRGVECDGLESIL